MHSGSETSGRVSHPGYKLKYLERKAKPYCCFKCTTAVCTAASLFNVPFHFAFPFSSVAYISGQEVSSCGGVEMEHL